MEYMMELSCKSEEELFADLKGVIFLNPLYEYGNSYEPKYLMADEYPVSYTHLQSGAGLSRNS